ncbi:MAG: membrane-bound PQQ-dependent dehydrogenase, glucose/quinate/shikimate family [Caulobacteraceae bacterium]|nr:MAG: membrane-bound PQQ-dependent dehydrogenase, glucose/quinate/shikimate family [Caulobacteraceae bacterium]
MALNRTGWAKAFPLIVGGVLALIGAVLLVGGFTLIGLGGSPYYLLAGAGLLISGGMIAMRRALGVWVYLGVFVATLLWALWEVGLQGWPLVPRLFAPLVLLIPVLLVFPRIGGDRRTGGTLWAALAALVVVGGIGIYFANWGDEASPLPAPSGMITDREAGGDWPAYGGTYGARRYSTLNQITPENVSGLKAVWTARTRDLPSARARDKYGAETTPLKVGDSLYLCTPKNILIALDAASGKERWRHDPKVADDWIPYTAACRGVVYYASPQAVPGRACGTRIIEGTLDARLIAVDAATGQRCEGFGTNGEVDTKLGMGKVAPGMVSITSAPTVVRDILVVGHQILDGQERNAPSGVVQGFDARTGELKWAWDLARPDLTGLPPEGQEFTRGTPNMWTTATGDEQLGLVYLPLGNSAVDYWSGSRTPPENQYATSLVALDVTTGKPAWTFQTVRKDVWDYDLGSQATLVDFPTAAGPAPALVLPSKQGDIYILDRRTGRPLTAVQDRPVPGGGVEPAQRARTQPHSLYHTLRKADLTERSMWGMSPIDQMLCRIQFRKADYRGFYTPPIADAHYVEYPGYNGGSDWGGVAVDPVRGIIVANYNDMPNYNRLVPRAEADAKGWTPRSQARGDTLKGGAEGAGDPQAGTPYAIQVNAGWRMPFTGLLCKTPPYGGIRAIDLKTGQTLWDRPLGTARNNGPFGIPSMLPVEIGAPNNGGAVVTAGGLVFVAAATDDLIRAIDLRTGRTVWSAVLPGGGQATPMTYAVNGRQYLVIMAGGHHFMETKVSDALVAYALP